MEDGLAPEGLDAGKRRRVIAQAVGEDQRPGPDAAATIGLDEGALGPGVGIEDLAVADLDGREFRAAVRGRCVAAPRG